jgi:hypothetical protein
VDMVKTLKPVRGNNNDWYEAFLIEVLMSYATYRVFRQA